MSNLTDHLLDAIKQLADCRILVAGDLMLDRFVYGAVERISPEAPIPILRCSQTLLAPGGAGNVLSNIHALGGTADLVAPVGKDAPGETLIRLLRGDKGITLSHVMIPDWPTTVKTRFISDGQQLLRVDEEQQFTFTPKRRRQLESALFEAMQRCDVLVLSDYGKGLLDTAFCRSAMALAHRMKRQVIVDPKGKDYERYRGADIITPNRRELADASGMPVGSSSEIEAAARSLITRFGVGAVLATRSEEGMSFVPAQGETLVLPTVAREVFDVSGAGDTVVSTVAAGIAAGLPISVTLQLANIAAGIVVGKTGTAVASPLEMETAVRTATAQPAEKLFTIEALVHQVAAWRTHGMRVGFTNGCFDILHLGHARLFEFARSHCDRLVVAINADESVRRLKGPTRPINSQTDRAALLASLAAVDAVVVYDVDTPLQTIQALKPDLLVKGADYTMEQIVGADFVHSHGGKVLRFELLPDKSTTAIIGKSRASAVP